MFFVGIRRIVLNENVKLSVCGTGGDNYCKSSHLKCETEMVVKCKSASL